MSGKRARESDDSDDDIMDLTEEVGQGAKSPAASAGKSTAAHAAAVKKAKPLQATQDENPCSQQGAGGLGHLPGGAPVQNLSATMNAQATPSTNPAGKKTVSRDMAPSAAACPPAAVASADGKPSSSSNATAGSLPSAGASAAASPPRNATPSISHPAPAPQPRQSYFTATIPAFSVSGSTIQVPVPPHLPQGGQLVSITVPPTPGNIWMVATVVTVPVPRASGGPSAGELAKERLAEALDSDVGIEHTDSDEQTFAAYVPSIFTMSCFASHPDEIFETSSMSCLLPPKTSYKLNICSETILRGLLTNAQLEAISLACAQHELRLPGCGERAAFFLGDGPGVGKGRQAAGIIFENFLRGRKRALWLSASPDLVSDARRDLNDIGAENVSCWNLRDYAVTERLDDAGKWEEDRLSDGVLFSTYMLLTSDREAGKRIDQIVEWCGGDTFDGPVILDECHKAKKLAVVCSGGGRRRRRRGQEQDDDEPKGWGKSGQATKTATFVAELQERLPNARITYVSATGASEPKHFMQLSRLGLWGSGTSFKDAEDFVQSIKKGGVGAMELVAMHMKACGQYISRSLSFSTATFELVNVPIDGLFKRKYDGACKLWSDFFRTIMESDLGRPRYLLGIMWGAHQRFFGHMIMAAKVPVIVALVKRSLAEGKCCVIGLQSTGEASSEEAVQKMAESGRIADWGDINSTAASNFTRIVDACKGYLDEGKRQEFLKRCDELRLPPNPLDDIIHKLGGPDKVAEMTARKMRFVNKRGKWEYVRRLQDKDSDELTLNIEERKNFQDGRKLVAIISEAASAGISLQADRRVANQRRRVHITLQLPWAADQAVQQMGRSHRSNQTSAPEFKLLMTSIGGERRFASAVASRLQSLGALMRGDRRAAGLGGCVMQSFAIEGKYGRMALSDFMSIVFTGRLTSQEKTPEYIAEMFASDDDFESFRLNAGAALTSLGVFDEDSTKKATEELHRFMNRLLGVTIDLQAQMFTFFSQLMEYYIAQDKLLGKYEEGICDVAGKNKHVCKVEKLYECPRTGAVTEYVHLASDRGVSWEEANRLLEEQKEYASENNLQDDRSGFYRDDSSQKDFRFVLALRRKQAAGDSRLARYIFIRPNTGNSRQDYSRVELRYKTKVPPSAHIQAWWVELYEYYYDKCTHQRQKNRTCRDPTCTYGKRTQPIHLITGLCLPFWKELKKCVVSGVKMGCKVVRVQPDQGQRLVGILVQQSKLEEVKAIIRRGTQSDVGIEDRSQRMVDSPFYEETKVVKLHDCLNPTGLDGINFELPSGWQESGDGAGSKLFIQIYEIPFQNAADGEDDKSPLWPTLWRSATQLSVLKQGTNDQYETVSTPFPPRRVKGSELCEPIDVSTLVGVGSNKLRVKSVGERFCVAIKIMKELPLDTVVKNITEVARKSREWSTRIIKKLLGDDNDDCVITELNVSIKCPLLCGRIKNPCRGLDCEHFNAFDLATYLEFSRRRGKWECPVCNKPTLPWNLVVCPIFESILAAVASQPGIESCKIDKAGNISTGNQDVDVKVKDGAGARNRVKQLPDDDPKEDAAINVNELAGASGAVCGGEDVNSEKENGSVEKWALLEHCGLWERRQEAEDEFREPANVLAASIGLWDEDEDEAEDAGAVAVEAQTNADPEVDRTGGEDKKVLDSSTSLNLDDSEDDSWLG